MSKRPHLIPALIVAILLAVAIAQLPYGYYTFLRWATCAVAVFIAFQAYQWKRIWATWLFGAIAILFNPFVPVYLTKEIWQPIDIVCALLFVASIFFLKEPADVIPMGEVAEGGIPQNDKRKSLPITLSILLGISLFILCAGLIVLVVYSC